MGPKKPSGSAFKKAREARNEAGKKLAMSLGRWLSQGDPGPSNLPETRERDSDSVYEINITSTTEVLESEEGVTEERIHSDNVVSCEPGAVEQIASSEEEVCLEEDDMNCLTNLVEMSKVPEIIYDDPCKWPNITDSVRTKLVERGPQTVDVDNFNFPVSDDARHLSKKWFFKELSNGERVKRHWMLYSESKNAVFCFPCILFGKKNNSAPGFADTNVGFSDWKHLNPQIQLHENTETHRKCYVEWKELEVRLKKNACLDADLQKQLTTEKEKWRQILKIVVDVVMFCAKNNLPLRGSSDFIGDQNCGVFLSTLELISHYHPLLRQHISYVRSNKNVTSYFSPTIQNEIVNILGNRVRSHILGKVKAAKYFSILFDCTPDVSHTEQMSQILRFVEISNRDCKIVESFVDFLVSHKKTGEGISNEILSKLKEDGLDIKDCRGQGFDNGSNMAGIYNGVQAHISRINELAKFVPCAAHSLNLVGVHAAEVSPMMITFFGIIQNIFCFLSGSTLRWEFVKPYLDTTVKGHSDTRWSSKRQAITSVENNITGLYTALKGMTNNEEWNKETTLGASSIIKNIDFKFVCLLHLWSEILVSVDCTNKLLQRKDTSLDAASKSLSALSKKFQKRRKEGIEDIIAKAVKTCEEIDVDCSLHEKCIKRKKTLDSEKAKDEGCSISAKQDFQRECFCVYDRLTAEMTTRSKAFEEVANNFQFLAGSSLKNWSLATLENCAKDFGLMYNQDVDSYELLKEIGIFKFQMIELIEDIESASHLDILKAIHAYQLQDAYPNIEISLRIFLTMPVSVASCERSFSKLKLIKNYLRSRTGQTRLTSLAILSIENEAASKLNFDDVISEFASIKARKISF